MDKQQAFKMVLATLNEVYDKKLSQQAQDIWWKLLNEYSGEQISKAMHSHCSDPDAGRFPPKPADLIAKIKGNSKQKELSVEDSAMREWEKIKTGIRKIGAYGKYESDDKVAIKAIISLGGWTALCHSPEAQLDTWKRKEFIEAYKIFVGAKDLPQYAPGISHESGEKIEARDSLQFIKSKLGERDAD